ncbi:MAG: acetyl/propionyl/methylcrotonyl-CoA carboxylase subunit alpha [Alphaproteobacteria bacterium]|nr:acetyl/propionyl/methylcrotonyl-CoA carboxylase subunit alpha [Alphaproteobacteria bacterium]
MFSKILIANRGEIACRVMVTARRLGIATVAVYSEADRDALHVQMADEAVLIGPAPSAESYLVIDRIVQAARDTGAEAIHPGYGFLSENQEFARALEGAGIVFIGPNVGAIAAMGDKIESKKLALDANINTVPGHAGLIEDADAAIEVARDIGYPVMIKASAGGGGKGMRVAYTDDQARDGFRSAQSEAKSSFADDRIFVEKFIEEPRHIEIQILADTHGNVIYLGERECSIQRRHQKVIEEAPSPFLDSATREAMGAQAVALARAVDYQSAGTVEFIVDRDRNFYFLEMNTRLQVEHPVTEFITGLDLVEQMIRVAAGEKLELQQNEVTYSGWAVETRVYAEDPLRNFLPSIGRLTHYREPAGEDGVRVDTGVFEGGEISMYYDPMIAKVITHGVDREQAIERMRGALDAFYIRGVSHNIPFLSALMAHPRFVQGDLSTNFIADEFPDGFAAVELSEEDLQRFIAVLAALHRMETERATHLGGQLDGREVRVAEDWVVIALGRQFPVRTHRNGDAINVEIAGTQYAVDGIWRPGLRLFRGLLNSHEVCFQVDKVGLGHRLTGNGASLEARVVTPRVAELSQFMPVKEAADLSNYLLSPMPGLLISVAVEVGQDVKAGEELAIVEAMKMENVLRAERDGVVKELHATPGESLAVDQAIVEFE